MTNRTNFGQLLDRMIVAETTPTDEIEIKFRPMLQEIHRIMPEKLFRYRECTLRNIEAFNGDLVYAVTQNLFNDPYDGLLKYDEVRLKKFFEEMSSPENMDMYHSLITTGLEVSEKTMPLLQLLPKELIEKARENVQYLKDDSQLENKLIPFFEGLIENAFNNFAHIADLNQLSTTVACFSETINSVTMWSHYADCHKGFALEYNGRDYLQGPKGSTMFYPVIYDDKRHEATNHLIWQYACLMGLNIPNSDIMAHTRCLLHKSKQWEYEQEWRLIDSQGEITDEKSRITRVSLKPTAIYYGHLISSDDKEFLHAISSNKGINEYEMYIDYTSDEYEMKFRKI